MNTWILIIVLFSNRGVAIQDTEFNSEQACKEAIVKLDYIDSGWNSKQINMTCVNKGEKQ